MKLVVILLFVMFAAMFAVVYLGGCYDAHAAEPCEDSESRAWVGISRP